MAQESTYQTLVKRHLWVYPRSWSEMHRLLMPIFQALFWADEILSRTRRVPVQRCQGFDFGVFRSHAEGFISMCIYKTKIFHKESTAMMYRADNFIRKFPAKS